MKKNNVLCISFWTPPIIRPQSILIGKMIPEWVKQGVSPIILNYDLCHNWEIDLPIYSVPDYRQSKSLFLKLPILRWINEYIYYKKLFRVGSRIIKKHEIKSVFSFSNPQSSNILGAILKKRLGIKFIAHFSDPWFDNEYKSIKKIAGLKIYFLEKFIIKWADKIVFTNENALSLVMKKYPKKWKEKAIVIPHSYDPSDYPAPTNKKNEKFVISHIGAFYKERNPEIFFKTLKKIKSIDRSVFEKIELRLVGAENQYAGYSKKDLDDLINSYELTENIKLIPSVDYKKSLEYMVCSNCLLVIDANFKCSPYLPSKLIDYAGSKKMIIAITPKNSPTENVVRVLGFKAFTYEEINKLANYLVETIKEEKIPQINQNTLNQFNVRETTKNLLSIINE